MTTFGAIVVAAVLLLSPSVGQGQDDRPIAEPAVDPSSEHLVRDGAWAMTTYQLRKVLPALGTSLHLIGPREAANVDARDEAPDSTWFTNRHARRRLSPAALARGPNGDHAPAPNGPLVVVSAKPKGMTQGFVVRDVKGDRYLVKLDPPGYPEVPTGAEMVCTKILYALGWNVPENYLLRLDPQRLVVEQAEDAQAAGHDPALTDRDLQIILAQAAHLPDGSMRVVASRWLPGKPKGGFQTIGRRADDPDDGVPHEDRRELRGLRVVAAWINYTDARRGNFLDMFVPAADGAGERGHLVHYVLDFSSALGAGNDDWKSPRYGHEYFIDPKRQMARVLTLGLVEPSWAHVPLAHPALGYFDADTFEPEEWRTTYPNPLFDAATVRDAFWGAKLVSAFSDDDLAVVARAGEWSDPRAAVVLADLLRRRQRVIARTYFDTRHINPTDGFAVSSTDGNAAGQRRLRFRDLAVESGVADVALARYRNRAVGGAGVTTPELPIALSAAPTVVELETSHDGGVSWSPPTRVTIAARLPGASTARRSGGFAVTAIERATR